MARIPDRFDLWVRKARECGDPVRRVDLVLGSLVALGDWYFFNQGSKQKPQVAEVEMEQGRYVLVFSDAGRIGEMLDEAGRGRDGEKVIAIPTIAAMAWCLEREAEGYAGLLVNPGDYAVLVPMEQLRVFEDDWKKRGAREASGFWIPNLTTEEEDFWQENGL